MVQLYASQTKVVERKPNIPSGRTGPTIPAFVGVCQRGPLNQAVRLTSWDDYVRVFGKYHASTHMPQAIKEYFDKGGRFGYVVRVCHLTDPTNRNSFTALVAELTLQTSAGNEGPGTVLGTVVEPFPLADTDDIQVRIINDGGAPATYTVTLVAHVAERAAGGAEPYVIANGETLIVAVNGGAPQTISFDPGEITPGAATAQEVINVLNAKLAGVQAYIDTGVVKVRTDRAGSGAILDVQGGTANVGLAFTTGPTTPNPLDNVIDVANATANELEGLLTAAIGAAGTVSVVAGKIKIESDGVGTDSSVQVLAGSSADTKVGLDNVLHGGTTGAAVNTLKIKGKYAGAYGNAVQPKIEASTDGVAEHFNLAVYVDGVLQEAFPNLTMDDTSADYAETRLESITKGSALVEAEDVFVGVGTPAQKRPANTVVLAPLVGGGDGLVGIADSDWIGDASAETGFHALDLKKDVTDLLHPGRATPGTAQGALSYCDLYRQSRIFGHYETPDYQTVDEAITYVETTAVLERATGNGAVWFPWGIIPNPDQAVFGDAPTIRVPPAGSVMGRIAFNDANLEGGIHQSPAGLKRGTLPGWVGVGCEEVNKLNKRELLAIHRINYIIAEPGQPIKIDDAMCLDPEASWPNVCERRGTLLIMRRLESVAEFFRHDPIDADVLANLDKALSKVLVEEMNAGAFVSRIAAEAFFVKTGQEVNTAITRSNEQMIAEIGIAKSKPGRFVVLYIGPDQRALEAALAAIAG